MGIGLVFALAMPVMYAVMGFVMGALMAWIYNWVAGRWGGMDLDLRMKQAPIYQSPV